MQRADGPYLFDVDGNRYIDFAAGIAVVNTGHRHPKVMQAVKDQIGVPVLTDVHEDTPVAPVADIIDVIQTPAFLCRQTNFMQKWAAIAATLGLVTLAGCGGDDGPMTVKGEVVISDQTGPSDRSPIACQA